MTLIATDGRAAAIYRRILDAVGDRADEVGADRQVAAHWPFVGAGYRGLVVAGQALDGWDAPITPARWSVSAMRSPEARPALLRGAQEWAGRPDPITEPMRYAKRRRAPFWGLSKRIAPLLEPGIDGAWHTRYAWWNVYPLGWDNPSGSPTGLLKELQRPHVCRLFWAVLDELDADRVVLVSGKDWWPEVRELLGLRDLAQAGKPLIAAGRARDVSFVATYHPGARMKGTSRDAFASAVAAAFAALER